MNPTSKKFLSFWYAADEPHFLVRYEDRHGRLSELAGFE